MTIGFVGQGWVGRHYADDFEARGFSVVRYGLEEDYRHNREKIRECAMVFIAVPTPTTPSGFDESAVRDALGLLSPQTIAVVKSTLLPGTTARLQESFPDLFVMHSPEFLVEKTAAYDAAHPQRNIIGIPEDTPPYRDMARKVMDILPPAPYSAVVAAHDAEMIKYAGNCFLFTKVVYMNLLYEMAEAVGCDWRAVREAMIHDPRIGNSHTEPAHGGGRGAGGHCFIKDFEAFRQHYDSTVGDSEGSRTLDALIKKNLALLNDSQKDEALVRSVYGDISKTSSA